MPRNKNIGRTSQAHLHKLSGLRARLNALMNRAFSADGLHPWFSLGAAQGSPRRIRPVADWRMNAAPLALNTYVLYVHIAIDRFDGTIAGQQLEEVIE